MLSELAKTYVYGATEFDVTMRSRIAKTIEIVNNYPAVSQILIKGDPFKLDHSSGQGTVSSDIQSSSGVSASAISSQYTNQLDLPLT